MTAISLFEIFTEFMTYGCALKDGTKLNLSDKDQKWVGVKDTFKF